MINEEHFSGCLDEPIFRIHQHHSFAGSFDASTHELSLSFALLGTASLIEIEWVLKHEMAHQWVALQKMPDESAHGPRFQEACVRLGISHSATFHKEKPSGLQAKLAKCLALSQSDNPHEAALAMKKAQELAERCFAFDPNATSPFVTQFLATFVRRRAIDKALAGLIHQYYGIYAVWIESESLNGSKLFVLEISGLPHDLEIATHIWHFLLAELERLWRVNKSHCRGSKREFQLGVLVGIRSQLQKPDSNGSGLVHLRDEALSKFVRHRLGRLSSGRKSRYYQSEAYQSGFEKGRQLKIRNPIKGQKTLSIGS